MNIKKDILKMIGIAGGTSLATSGLVALIITKSNQENYELSKEMNENSKKNFERIIKEKEELKELKKQIQNKVNQANAILTEVESMNDKTKNLQDEMLESYKKSNNEILNSIKETIGKTMTEAKNLALKEIKESVSKAQDEIALEDLEENNHRKGIKKK